MQMALAVGLKPWEYEWYEYNELWYTIKAHNDQIEANRRLVWESTRMQTVMVCNSMGAKLKMSDIELPWDKENGIRKGYSKEERAEIEARAKALGF